eukprot:scaffold35672_cov66-Phaeocystis_antarctica.AAC.1
MDTLAAAAELEVALGIGSSRRGRRNPKSDPDPDPNRHQVAKPEGEGGNLNLTLTLTLTSTLTRWPSRRVRRSSCGCRWCSTTRMRRGTRRGDSTTRTPSDRVLLILPLRSCF